MSLTVRLAGGIGNAMFQYGFGLATAQRLGTDLVLNTSSYHGDSLRQHSLGLWKGVTEKRQSYPPQPPIVTEQGLPYCQSVVNCIRDGDTISGYWQSEKYCGAVKEELKGRFVPKQPLTDRAKQTLQLIRSAGPRSTFLTIRRTDYLSSDFHGVLPISYYLAALKIIAAKVDPIVFVFSDEPEWCEANLKLPYPMFVSGNWDRTTATHLGREDSELTLMASCHNSVMANSSYSWWGAWLGADELGGTIVAPRNWFGPASNEDPKDIIPSRWHVI